jgi:guanylate kinase
MMSQSVNTAGVSLKRYEPHKFACGAPPARVRDVASRRQPWRHKLHGPGLLFILSGPSGAGKDTVVKSLLARRPELQLSVSATTRAPRPGEEPGRDYFFVTREEFERRRASGGFLETKEYNGQLYGTPRSFVEERLSEGYDVIMKPEVTGALEIKSVFPAAALIFLLPDKFSYLQSRLAGRRTESNEEIATRLAIAREEFAQVRSFDYLIINEERHPERAVDDLDAIIRAERFRIHRYDDRTLRRLELS